MSMTTIAITTIITDTIRDTTEIEKSIIPSKTFATVSNEETFELSIDWYQTMVKLPSIVTDSTIIQSTRGTSPIY